jgi:hypothetical protein
MSTPGDVYIVICTCKTLKIPGTNSQFNQRALLSWSTPLNSIDRTAPSVGTFWYSNGCLDHLMFCLLTLYCWLDRPYGQNHIMYIQFVRLVDPIFFGIVMNKNTGLPRSTLNTSSVESIFKIKLISCS